MKNIVIFGAGIYGERAIHSYGADRIKCVVDNDISKSGREWNGFVILSYDEYVKNKYYAKDIIVICARWNNALDMIEQLKSDGILNCKVYGTQLFENIDLIFNQYLEAKSDFIWDDQIEENMVAVRRYMSEIKDIRLFHEIEIETYNRCNGVCSFCPVSVKNEVRKETLMKEDVFLKIVKELSDLNYCGRVALFSNNEPFLDPRIIEFSRILRVMVPNAQIHMFTNGSLLTIEKFDAIIPYLDELIIDNYNQNLKLNSMVLKIKEHVENDENNRHKVKILLRKTDEVLSTRGGDAPNKKYTVDVGSEQCALPWCQMVVRPSGEVSLCCNDPYGRMTMGNVNFESLKDIWYGTKYTKVREELRHGREKIEHCKNCDTFMTI